jgi:hypothetical protein
MRANRTTAPHESITYLLDEHFATVEVAARRLGVSPTSVWRFAQQGVLTRRHALGRTFFSVEEIERLAAARGR